MDIARPDIARKKRLRRGLYSVTATVVVVLVTIGVSRLEPAAPSVDRDTVFLDTVERGDFVRNVRGTGELVPEEIRWIPATTVGNIERIVLDPGAVVTPDSIIVELSNPELAQTLLESALQLREAEAGYTSRQAELGSQLLAQRSSLATIEAGLTQARLKAEANQRLADAGLLSDLDLQQSLATEQELESHRRDSTDALRVRGASEKYDNGPRQASEGRAPRGAARTVRRFLCFVRVRRQVGPRPHPRI